MEVALSTVQELYRKPQQYGIASNTLIRLDGNLTSDHAAYLDLIARCDWAKLGLAVIEDQSNALLYVLPVEAWRGQDEGTKRDWLNVLACRGDARYLAVVHPGRLDFYPLYMRAAGESVQAERQDVPLSDLHGFLIGAWVEASPKNKQQDADKKWLNKLLFNVLSKTADHLRSAENQLSDSQVLALVGRALFTRFIADRGIVQNKDVADIAKSQSVTTWKQLFDTPQTLARTCAWLDRTFNGNLLPVLDEAGEYPIEAAYEIFFQQHIKTHQILSDVLHSTPGGQVQLELGWQDIRFEHVPADMLSQVYEEFAHKFQTAKAKSTSIYYTPRRIAQQLVNAAFAGSELEDKSHAHLLDPSVGAGVFLVLAYKRLVKERWQKTGKQPKREELRTILNEQLCGLDINEQSLKFAALSLYLTALELDPDPQPLTDLKFEPLNERVLWCVDGPQYQGLGSLHPHWVQAFNHRFDMVVGNPPWTKPKDTREIKAKAAIASYTKVVRECAEHAGIAKEVVSKLQAEQGNPDPVFVWRSLNWAKPNGMLAFALHAQHMLFQKGKSFELRQALLQCVELTGVVNGSALRKTEIWPSQTHPFCLWIARNRVPQEDSCFYYLNPSLEKTLHQREQYRLDPHDAQVVFQSVVQSSLDAFKVLAKGSGLSWSVIEQIKSSSMGNTLEQYWTGQRLNSSGGCKTNKGKDDGAAEFNGMPFLTSKYKDQAKKLLINVRNLPPFVYEFPIDRARDPLVYREPLVLFIESPYSKAKHLMPYGTGGFLSSDSLIYNFSFFGYSCAGHEQAELLARYLQLLSVSSVFSFVLLLTSPKLGVEREALQKEDVDQFPFIPLEHLPSEVKTQIPELSSKLLAGEKPWTEINEWTRKIYNLSKPDMQVIEDTLRTAWPRNAWAEERPTPEQFEEFASAVQSVMQPFADIAEVLLNVQICATDKAKALGWTFVKVTFGNDPDTPNSPPQGWQEQLAIADQFWASQVKIYADESQRVLYVGQLARNRYWTKTRARVLAMDLLNNNLEQHGKYAQYGKTRGRH